MCGRYKSCIEDETLVRIIERERVGNAARYLTREEVFPGAEVPVIYGSYSTVRAHMSTWGFTAPGTGAATDSAGCMRNKSGVSVGTTGVAVPEETSAAGQLIINARAESVTQKSVFKSAFYTLRTLIPASGYYEWMGRVKYYIAPRQGKTLLLAGIAAQDNLGAWRHVILNRHADEEISHIHDRMPLVIGRDDMKNWLYDDSFATSRLRGNYAAGVTVQAI